MDDVTAPRNESESQVPRCINEALLPVETVMDALSELKSNCSWLESLMADEMYMNGPTVEDIWATKISNDTMELAMGPCGRGERMKRGKLSDFEGSYLHNAADSCTLSACQNTFSLGNPDIAGIGMIASYYFQVAFITFHYLAHIPVKRMIRSLRRPGTEQPVLADPSQNTTTIANPPKSAFKIQESFLTRHTTSITQTSLTFLDSSTFVAVSTVIAQGVFIGGGNSNRANVYDNALSFSAFVLAINTLYVTFPFCFPYLRRRGYRMSVVYTCILLSMLRGLFGGPLLQRQGELVGAQWWMWCIKRNLYTSDPSVKRERQSEAQIFLAWMAVYACFSLYWTHVWHHSTINRLRRRLLGCSEKRKDGSGTDEENGYRRRRRRGCLCDDSAWKHTKVGKVVHKLLYSKNIAIWATSTFGLVNAWLTLADLIITRNQVHRLAGEKFEDDELGYGQIVAALLWLPVVVEYGYIFSFGAKRGLRGRLPTTYTAVRIRDSGLHEMHHEKWYEREQRWVAEVRERSNSSMSITSIELPLHRTSTYRPSVGDWNAQVSAASEDALVGGGGGYLYGEPVGVAVGGEDGFYRTYGEWETPDAESEDRYGYGGEHDGEQSGR